jgi:hypothetical protein
MRYIHEKYNRNCCILRILILQQLHPPHDLTQDPPLSFVMAGGTDTRRWNRCRAHHGRRMPPLSSSPSPRSTSSFSHAAYSRRRLFQRGQMGCSLRPHHGVGKMKTRWSVDRWGLHWGQTDDHGMTIDQSSLLKEPLEFASVPQIWPLPTPQPTVEYVTKSRMAPGLKPMQWPFMAPGPAIPIGSGLEPSTT